MDASFIITTYNYELYLGRAIRSCLSQDYDQTKMEIIVVDDGSTDNTGYILDAFGDSIRTINFSENHGVSNARNEGIKAARGRYITLLDADDYLHAEYLRTTMLYMQFNHNEVDAVAVDHLLIDSSEEVIGRISQDDSPQACGILFQKDHLVDIGLYDPTINICEEVDLRIRFLKKYRIGSIDFPLYRYRLHGENLTNGAAQDIRKSMNYIRNKHDIDTADISYPSQMEL